MKDRDNVFDDRVNPQGILSFISFFLSEEKESVVGPLTEGMIEETK